MIDLTKYFGVAPNVETMVFRNSRSHVEGRTDKTRNPPPPSDPPAVLQLRDKENVFDLGTTDELWDRD